jgi:hypothetical protein
MAEISEQLAYISSVKQLEEAKSASDLYLHPPIEPYGMFKAITNKCNYIVLFMN